MNDGSSQETENARALYEHWDFVQRAVRLYTNAVAWKGATIHGWLPGEDASRPLLEIAENTLQALFPPWFIDGRCTAVVEHGGAPRLLPAERGDALNILTPAEGPTWASAGRGRSRLSSASANYPIIERMQDILLRTGRNESAEMLLKITLSEAKSCLSLPDWAYDPAETARAGIEAVLGGLNMFRLMVRTYRRDFFAGVIQDLNQWFEDRYPGVRHLRPISGGDWPSGDFAGWEGVYWAFKESGLPLTEFGVAFPAWLRNNSMFVNRHALSGWAELGL